MPAPCIASVPAEAAEWILRRKPGCFALGGENLQVPVLLATAFTVGRAGFSLQLGGGGAGAHWVDHAGWDVVWWQDLSIQSPSRGLSAADTKSSLKHCNLSSRAAIKKNKTTFHSVFFHGMEQRSYRCAIAFRELGFKPKFCNFSRGRRSFPVLEAAASACSQLPFSCACKAVSPHNGTVARRLFLFPSVEPPLM